MIRRSLIISRVKVSVDVLFLTDSPVVVVVASVVIVVIVVTVKPVRVESPTPDTVILNDPVTYGLTVVTTKIYVTSVLR